MKYDGSRPRTMSRTSAGAFARVRGAESKACLHLVSGWSSRSAQSPCASCVEPIKPQGHPGRRYIGVGAASVTGGVPCISAARGEAVSLLGSRHFFGRRCRSTCSGNGVVPASVWYGLDALGKPVQCDVLYSPKLPTLMNGIIGSWVAAVLGIVPIAAFCFAKLFVLLTAASAALVAGSSQPEKFDAATLPTGAVNAPFRKPL